MRNEVSIGRERRLSSCCQISVLSLLIVTLGIVHAVADGVADADGVGLEDLEGDGLAEGLSELFVEGLTGSTVSLPLWAGPQALSARPAVRHSPRARQRVLRVLRPPWLRRGRWVRIRPP
jgi:hypothetical protein